MWMEKRIVHSLIFLCATLLALSLLRLASPRVLPVAAGSGEQEKPIQWVSFDVPLSALKSAAQADIDSHLCQDEWTVDWVELLAALACKYYGHWDRYQKSDLTGYVGRFSQGETVEEIAQSSSYLDYYLEAYEAVLGGFLGIYETAEKNPETGEEETVQTYGVKVFSPIGAGYSYEHYKDFGAYRGYGYSRPHLGNDLMGSVGTPIMAVEEGIVESCGWNQYGGWRVGIRSLDGKRYYYYAHLRKDHPYAQGIEEGARVKGGQQIGYLGMTGYSLTENVNGMQKPHLHFGMQLIFEESQKDGANQIWIDVYRLVQFLEPHRSYAVENL